MPDEREENLIEKEVTYTLYQDGKFYIVEHVPARVDVESGEQYFSPKTVEHLQSFWGRENLFARSRRRYIALCEYFGIQHQAYIFPCNLPQPGIN